MTKEKVEIVKENASTYDLNATLEAIGLPKSTWYYGSEFINDHLFRYCSENKIIFTRSRPYRKNDNCFVEQKSYSVVRRAVGYRRYDTEEEIEVLNELYATL